MVLSVVLSICLTVVILLYMRSLRIIRLLKQALELAAKLSQSFKTRIEQLESIRIGLQDTCNNQQNRIDDLVFSQQFPKQKTKRKSNKSKVK